MTIDVGSGLCEEPAWLTKNKASPATAGPVANLAAKERRERIAVACLQGILANPGFGGLSPYAKANVSAIDAVWSADALIARLDATEGKPSE